jgi:pimeloyl-ACP methyl ester carboxylesterase
MSARTASALFVSLVTVVVLTPAALGAPPDARPPFRDDRSLTQAIRARAAAMAPAATAAQAARYGLRLPDGFDGLRPLVVIVHGLDCDCVHWGGMAQCLIGEGYAVAPFTYPSDGPIAESAALLGEHMTALRRAFPAAEVNVLAYSMGGLVSRAYVEGPDYAGGVQRLILVGTPNTGSGWSRVRMLLEFQEHYRLWRDEPKWSPSWMITDGLGEAGRDLRPGSKFLTRLNALPRREGVKYTIICGDQSPASRIEADWLDRTAGYIPQRVSGWWGFRQTKSGLKRHANQARNEPDRSDGPVAVARAKLEGVQDVVIVHADHVRLYIGTNDEPPAAWDTIRDRLTHQGVR